VPPTDRRRLAGPRELLLGVLADGLKHPEARLLAGTDGALDQAAVDQYPEPLEHVASRQVSAAADGLGRFQRPATGEDGQAPEQRLLTRAEQVVAPGERLAQRLLALRQVGRPAGQQRESPVQSPQQGPRRQQPRPRRRQLDGQR
jgi:hypothetical protein